MQYVDSLVPTVRRALIDPLPEVRVAAAKTFDQLHNTIGTKALDDILPDLLKKMVICLFPALVLLSNAINQLLTIQIDFLLFLTNTYCSKHLPRYMVLINKELIFMELFACISG